MEKISAITLHYILKILQNHYKIDTKQLLIDIDISPDIFQKENSYVDSEKVKQLFMKAAQLCNDPCLSLKLGESSSPESMGLLGYMLSNTANIKEMLEKMCHFSPLIGKNLQFKLSKTDMGYKIALQMHNNPSILLASYQSEIHLSAIVSLIRHFSGREVTPEQAYFQHDKVNIVDAYEQLFGKVLHFNAYENALVFSHNTLKKSLTNAYPGMLKYFETQAKKIIEDLYEDTWTIQVKKMILLKLGNEDVDIESIAHALNISVRMLQKHLQVEGNVYSKLLEEVRKNLSKYYLKNFSIDIGTIALYLGYNDVTSFSRSFKKWFKESPNNYRKSLPFNTGHAAIS